MFFKNLDCGELNHCSHSKVKMNFGHLSTLILKGLGGGHYDPLRFFLHNSKTSRDFS